VRGVLVDKRDAHALLRGLLAAEALDVETRARVAHEVLVLAQQHTDDNLGRVL
jgi:hypothetical protein